MTKPAISIGFCKPTLRGIGRTDPERSWYAERMLSRHFDLLLSERPDFLIYGDAGSGEHLEYPASTVRIFITGENIAANWNEADYALTHERLYSERHWRIPLHRHWYDTTCSDPVRDFGIVQARVQHFCNFIYSNETANERIRFFDLLNGYRRVESGGKVRNNLGRRIDDKMDFISRCKFTIAFENESHPGYATEKIIQPLLNGSIPIYWGDPTIELDFNPECFVNVHRFGSFEAAVEEVRRIDQDDALWERYVTAPIFLNGRMPDELSDQAIIGFFQRLFETGTHHIPRAVKLAQRLSQAVGTSAAGNRARDLSTRGLNRLRRFRGGG